MNTIKSNPTPCRGCAAPIRWLMTPKGKRMPVDAEPVKYEDHIMELLVFEDGTVTRATVYNSLRGTGNFYTAHWATCPCAGTFRRQTTAQKILGGKAKG